VNRTRKVVPPGLPFASIALAVDTMIWPPVFVALIAWFNRSARRSRMTSASALTMIGAGNSDIRINMLERFASGWNWVTQLCTISLSGTVFASRFPGLVPGASASLANVRQVAAIAFVADPAEALLQHGLGRTYDRVKRGANLAAGHRTRVHGGAVVKALPDFDEFAFQLRTRA
jgi:hypothetical protein